MAHMSKKNVVRTRKNPCGWFLALLLERGGQSFIIINVVGRSTSLLSFPYTQSHFYIPPEDWWHTQALNRSLERPLRIQSPPSRAIAWKVLSEISNQHIKKSAWTFDDIYIPSSLPTSSSKLHSHIILHSAMMKELVAAGIEQPSLEISQRLFDMAH